MKFSDKFDLIQNENISLKITEKLINVRIREVDCWINGEKYGNY